MRLKARTSLWLCYWTKQPKQVLRTPKLLLRTPDTAPQDLDMSQAHYHMCPHSTCEHPCSQFQDLSKTSSKMSWPKGVAQKGGKCETHKSGSGSGWVGASSGGGDGDGHMDGCCALEASFHCTSASRVGRIGWHVHWGVLCLQVVNGGYGADDGFHGGSPLCVADHLHNVDWHGVWEWVEMGWWWTQWVKTTVVVGGAVPGGSCGGVGSQGVAWQLWTVVSMVAMAEGAPGVLCAWAEGWEVLRAIYDWQGWGWWSLGHYFVDMHSGLHDHGDHWTETIGFVDVHYPVKQHRCLVCGFILHWVSIHVGLPRRPLLSFGTLV